jgi:HUS1 checkpoint protein
MKFRAKLSKECLVVLHNIVITFEKIAGQATLFLTPDSLRISLISETIDAPKCFAEIDTSNLFVEYRVESQSSNTILFEISLGQLSKALASGKVASQSQLKLAKRDDKACLCFETKADESVLSVDVCHDIPIKLMRSTEVVHFLPPQLRPPEVALDLPRGKLVRVVIDKMSKFAKHVQITATQRGGLILKADHASVTINTYFTGLNAQYVGNMDRVVSANNQVVCKLNLRKLSVVLNTYSLPITCSTVCK